MKVILKQIPTTMTKPLSPRQKVQKLIIEISVGWCMEKRTKGLPPLRRPKISKKDKIEKIYEANRYCNDWKFQLHWNNLEWVNQRIQIKSTAMK